MATREQISVQAYNRKVNEQFEKLRRDLEGGRDKILRDAKALEEKLKDDPIRVAGIRYAEGSGLSSQPITLEGGGLALTVNLISVDTPGEDGFDPASYTCPTAKMRPLGLILSEVGTFVPLAIENFELSYRIQLNWVKERLPQESKVFLVDRDGGEYYYPIDTDLRGEVLAGYPRIGLIAFEPFRRPTESVVLSFSGVKLLMKRGATETFDFSYRSPTLIDRIQSTLSKGSILERIRIELSTRVANNQELIEQERKSLLKSIPRTGCLVVLVALGGAGAIGTAIAHLTGQLG